MKMRMMLLSCVLGVMLMGPAWADDPNVPGPGMVAHLKFDGDVLDAFGNVTDANLVGDVSFIDGALGQALSLGGDGDYVHLGPDFGMNVLQPLTDMTASVWVLGANDGPTGVYPRVFNIGNANNTEYIALLPFSDGTPEEPKHQGACGGPRFEVKTQANGNQTTNACIATMEPNEWNHIVATLDNDANTAALYVNGLFVVDNNAVTGNPSMVSLYDEAVLGTAPLSKNKNYYKGAMDDLRIYNYVLDVNEIAALANPGGPIAHWAFEGDLTDSSGNGWDAVYVDPCDPEGQPMPAFGEGVVGQAIVESREDFQYSMVPGSNEAFNLTEAFTINAWINTTSTEFGSVFAKQDRSAAGTEVPIDQAGFVFNLDKKGKVILGLRSADVAASKAKGKLQNNDGNWHMITGVYSGATGELAVYVDGAVDVSVAWDAGFYPSTSPVTLGMIVSDYGFMGSFFDGKIDELKVWDVALSADEIAAMAAE